MPTKIEWTHPPGFKGETWNPVTGCTKISPGCAHCYAEAITLRFKRGGPFLPGKTTIKVHEDRLDVPLKWQAPRCIFTCSMSDLFHEEVPKEFILRCFLNMADTPHHIYQVLTKRPERMVEVLDHEFRQAAEALGINWPLDNVWLGTSVENQVFADRRIPILLSVPARVHFLSIEPLIKHVDLAGYLFRGECIDWVIVGGESGPKHRIMEEEWVRLLRDQCSWYKVPFFLKQWGGALPGGEALLDGEPVREWPLYLGASA